MKIGIFDHLERRRDVPLDQKYQDRLDLVARPPNWRTNQPRQF